MMSTVSKKENIITAIVIIAWGIAAFFLCIGGYCS